MSNKDWVRVNELAESGRSPNAVCILELLARIEALEANSSAGLTSFNHPEKPDSLLVKRVHSCIVGEPECGYMQARAVIREVARWIDAEAHQRGLQAHNGVYSAADWLRAELEAAP